MNTIRLLMHTYYEHLYELLDSQQARILLTIDDLLPEEIKKRHAGLIDPKKISAYRQACYDFLAERIDDFLVGTEAQ